ncbi:2OG-Fe dioxygenase family protein [Burkholderia sp. TSV86]|uniref:2OG-Fe dioxygenase family protein n=1 Tax=Burkholderia sp. TSV86 TaxID=1385594 RepID=UPI000753654E|nr:hypothetical protein WS68_17375 [Burkholderia sp. TSV86]
MQRIEEGSFPADPRMDSEIGNALRTMGWATFDRADLMLGEVEQRELDQLARYAQTLPLDGFGGDGRHRCYAEAVLTPSTRTLCWKPGIVGEGGKVEIEYQQATEFQPEYGGVRRRFLRANDHVLQLSLIHRLIWFDFDLTGWTGRDEPLQCGFHLVRLNAVPGKPSRSTPDCLHRDGQPYTAVHLVNRSGVSGGLNYIAAPRYAGERITEVPADALTTFMLTEPLDSYIIDDAAVCHHVSAVACAPGARSGARTVMLIDFSPIPLAS